MTQTYEPPEAEWDPPERARPIAKWIAWSVPLAAAIIAAACDGGPTGPDPVETPNNGPTAAAPAPGPSTSTSSGAETMSVETTSGKQRSSAAAVPDSSQCNLARPLRPNEQLIAQLFRGSVHHYRINIARAGTLTLRSTGIVDVVGVLKNRACQRIVLNDDGGTGLNFHIRRFVQPGVYYLEVRHYNAARGTGIYGLESRFTPGGSGPGGGNAAMTWVLSDRCIDGRGLRMRIRDVTNRLVWPGNAQVYTAAAGGSIRRTISCRTGARICYGGTTQPASNVFWGIGLDGRESCTNCCATCANTTIQLNLTCSGIGAAPHATALNATPDVPTLPSDSQ